MASASATLNADPLGAPRPGLAGPLKDPRRLIRIKRTGGNDSLFSMHPFAADPPGIPQATPGGRIKNGMRAAEHPWNARSLLVRPDERSSNASLRKTLAYRGDVRNRQRKGGMVPSVSEPR